MELVCIDKQTFEELRVRFCEFEDRVTRLCRPVEDLGLKNWLDNQEVCDVLRINKKTLQAYRAKGLLPFSRIKNKLFYKPEDIRRLLELSYHPLIKRQIIKYNVNKKLYINDVECATLGVFPTISDKIWLFRRNLTYTDQPCPSYIKLYSFKIYELGKLIRDFLPAKKDNKYCLYDRVTKTYYYDQYDNLTI